MANQEEALDFAVIADASRPGLAAIAAEVNDDAAEFQRRLEVDGVRASSARGGFLDEAKLLFDRLRGRREVADYGVHKVRLDWLGFHVPQGGAGTLSLTDSTEGKAGLELKVMGFGGGAGRDISLAAEHDFGARSQCFYLGVDLEVRLRSFADGGAAEANTMQVDVETLLGSYLRPEPICPFCFTGHDRKPLRAQASGDGWDLTADAQGLTKKISYELSRSLDLEVGLEVPLLNSTLKPAVEMSRKVKSACTAAYTFPGGACFTAYRMIGKPLDLPFWGKT